MKYANQISDDIIKTILSEKELQETKELAKALLSLEREKKALEDRVYEKLDGKVIGTLYEVSLEYVEKTDDIYFKYDANVCMHVPQKRTKNIFQTIWNALPF